MINSFCFRSVIHLAFNHTCLIYYSFTHACGASIACLIDSSNSVTDPFSMVASLVCLSVRLRVCFVRRPYWCPAALALSHPWHSATIGSVAPPFGVLWRSAPLAHSPQHSVIYGAQPLRYPQRIAPIVDQLLRPATLTLGTLQRSAVLLSPSLATARLPQCSASPALGARLSRRSANVATGQCITLAFQPSAIVCYGV